MVDRQLKINASSKCPLKVKQKLTMQDCNGGALSVQFDQDDKFIAVGCGDGTIKIFNAFTAKQIQSLGNNQHHQDQMPITCVRWRPQSSDQGQKASNVVVCTTSDGLIQHWAINSSKCMHTIKEESGNNLYALDFSPDGRVFAVGGQDTHLYVYDEQTRQQVADMKVGGKNIPGHSSRIFSIKFNPSNPNMILSGGWDRTIQIYDLREGRTIGSIYGPQISGDALDIHDDLIITGSNRNKDILQMFSLSQRKAIFNIDWESASRKDIESGYLFGCKFSKPHPNLIIAGGAGKNELKIIENNADGSANFRVLTHIHDLESPCLSLDVTKSGDNFAFGCQDGRVFLCNYKLEDGGDFEGYNGGSVKEHTIQSTHHTRHTREPEDEEEKKEQS